jgi:hypothetical protein
MNYYESVVIDYLRADRAVFVNTEYCLQLNQAANPDTSGPHWYCDAVALNFRRKEILLCEISYAVRLADLSKRLKGWHDNWDKVCLAVRRDSFFSEPWPVRPWLFVPKERVSLLEQQLKKIANGQPPKFDQMITPLEEVQPWCYSSFNRNGEFNQPTIPNIPAKA